jgi:TRAP transporter TAXI family solute receptor
LVDKRVAVGPAGSGAAASAQRFFESLGLWDKIRPQFIGYNQGASALGDRQIDALWVFAGFPNASVIQAATSNKVRLLQVYEAAQKGTLPQDHPYYVKVTIPAGTYSGVDYDVETISDGALWVAGRHVPEDLMYRRQRGLLRRRSGLHAKRLQGRDRHDPGEWTRGRRHPGPCRCAEVLDRKGQDPDGAQSQK